MQRPSTGNPLQFMINFSVKCTEMMISMLWHFSHSNLNFPGHLGFMLFLHDPVYLYKIHIYITCYSTTFTMFYSNPDPWGLSHKYGQSIWPFQMDHTTQLFTVFIIIYYLNTILLRDSCKHPILIGCHTFCFYLLPLPSLVICIHDFISYSLL